MSSRSPSPSRQQQQPIVRGLPTGVRFAMASVIDDAKAKGQEAKYALERPLPFLQGQSISPQAQLPIVHCLVCL